jgi:hypothetical protein
MKTLLYLLALLAGPFMATQSKAQAPEKRLRYDNWTTTVSTNDRSRATSPTKDVTTNFAVFGTQWDHRVITYTFANTTADIASDGGRQAVREAFALWEAKTSVRFLEVCSTPADIVLSWATGAHGDSDDFDGMGGVLAHAFAPPLSGVPVDPLTGDVHFDDAETWTTVAQGSANQPIDLVSIAAHEIGHSLGLDHTTVSGSLMNAYYSSSHRYLGPDDIAGIQSIYGAPGYFVSGPAQLCGSTAFAAPTAAPGTVFTWSSSNPNVATINPSTGVATPVGGGPVTFTATANSGCGIVAVSKTAFTGPPDIVDVTGSDAACGLRVISFTPQFVNAASNFTYIWDIIGTGATFKGSSSGPSITLNVATRYNFRVGVEVSNACGGDYSESMTFSNGSCAGPYGLAPEAVTAYPNPASETLTLPAGATSAVLLNSQGREVQRGAAVGILDVRQLPAGLYNLQTHQNGKVVNQRIEVKH